MFTRLIALTLIKLAQTCNLVVPPNPLTAQGLATPYIYVDCDQTNATQSSFIEAVILNKVTGALSVYTPLIINAGTQPLTAPIVPTLSQDDIVGIWFGSNANTLILNTTEVTCVNGVVLNGVVSAFGQVAACNAGNFITTANDLINQGILNIPALQTGANGKTCYTTRSFAVVDQDPSDNVNSKYLSVGTQIAQFSAANKVAFPNATELDNGSDNLLLDSFILPALNCTPFTVPDLVDINTNRSAQILNELQAKKFQARPQALVPLGDPMVLVNGTENINKLNAYRSLVDQDPYKLASTRRYCHNLVYTGLPLIIGDQQFTNVSVSPTVGMNLFVFLVQRFIATLNNLNCLVLLNITAPVTLDANNNVALTPPIPVPTSTVPVTSSVTSSTVPSSVVPTVTSSTVPSSVVPSSVTSSTVPSSVVPVPVTSSTVTVPTSVNFNYIIPNQGNPQLCMCACQFQM